MATESLGSYILPGALIAWLLAKWLGLGEKLRPCEHGVVGATAANARCSACNIAQANYKAATAAASERARLEEAGRQDEERKKVRELKRAFLRDCRTLNSLQAIEPYTFQRLTWTIFERIGFDVERTPAGRDGGADGILHREGMKWVLQCKRYRGDVGEPILRDLFGTLHHLGADAGILVTTGRISDPARAFAADKPLSLVDGKELLKLLDTAGLTEETLPDDLVVSRDIPPVLDPRIGRNPKCPGCGRRLTLKSGKYGNFWGCTGWPKCHYTVAADR